MSGSNTKRPSDFLLSRYILGECSEEDTMRVESWLCSSPDAEGEFERFKSTIKTEEKKAPSVFRKPDSVFTQIRQLPLFQSRIRATLVFSTTIGLLLFSLIFTNIYKNRYTDYTVLESTVTTAGFRDTLEALLRLTGQEQMTAFSSAPAGDVTQSSVNIPCLTSPVEGNIKADKIFIYQ